LKMTELHKIAATAQHIQWNTQYQFFRRVFVTGRNRGLFAGNDILIS